MNDIWNEVSNYASQINAWELIGLITGLLAVVFLIRQHILTWPFGIAYVLVSFVVFWEARLYGDFILHVIFLVLNVYGWIHWVKGSGKRGLPVSKLKPYQALRTLALTGIMIFLFAKFLLYIPNLWEGVDPPSLPYWDSTTSMLSVTGIWLQARKKIDNWYYWLIVDVLATGIYFYKELYFYGVLYMLYIGMAVAGYLAWKKSLN